MSLTNGHRFFHQGTILFGFKLGHFILVVREPYKARRRSISLKTGIISRDGLAALVELNSKVMGFVLALFAFLNPTRNRMETLY